MPFEPGKSGNPSGRAIDKPWRDAIRLAANEIDDKTQKKKIRLIAEAVVNAAASGDMQAAKEVGDRLDGKAPQAVVGGDGEGPIRHVLEVVCNGFNITRRYQPTSQDHNSQNSTSASKDGQ